MCSSLPAQISSGGDPVNKQQILAQEYYPQFDEIRKNAVAMSFFKYGAARENFSSGKVDAVASVRRCLLKYEKTGNTEYLADAANYLMFEFRWPVHPKAHFRSTESHESAGRVE